MSHAIDVKAKASLPIDILSPLGETEENFKEKDMIKPEELRIGNLISSKINLRDEMKVLQLFGDSFQAQYDKMDHSKRGAFMYESCEGIPLTPEWLERFGFTAYEYSKEAVALQGVDTYVKTYSLGKLTICDWGNGKFILTNAFNFDLRPEVKTIHHLQNLIFAITSSELVIK